MPTRALVDALLLRANHIGTFLGNLCFSTRTREAALGTCRHSVHTADHECGDQVLVALTRSNAGIMFWPMENASPLEFFPLFFKRAS